jgi:hypothetical protein
MLDPEARRLRGRIGAYALHAKYDSRALTAPARAKFLARFLEQVDPDRALPEPERFRRARQALRAHMARLALRSAQSRRNRAGLRRPAGDAGADAGEVRDA